MADELIEPNKIGDNRQPDGKFGPGNIANPNGRPPGNLSVVEAIKRQLKESPEGSDKTYLDLLIQRVFKKAIQEGDVGMIKDIINRVDGMPKGYSPDSLNIDNRKIEIIIKNEEPDTQIQE